MDGQRARPKEAQMDFKAHLEESLAEAEKTLARQRKQGDAFPVGEMPVHLIVSITVARKQVTTWKQAIKAYKKMGGK